MHALSKSLKEAFTAFASANAGEMLGRRAKHRHLGPHQPAHGGTTGTTEVATETAKSPVPAAAPRRGQVALWLNEMPTPAVLSYALSSCQRMDMELLILHGGKLRAQPLLAAHGEAIEAAGISVDIQALADTEEATLFNHVTRHPRIAFIIIGSPNHIMDARSATPPVPLVVVTSAETASGLAEQAIAA